MERLFPECGQDERPGKGQVAAGALGDSVSRSRAGAGALAEGPVGGALTMGHTAREGPRAEGRKDGGELGGREAAGDRGCG